MSVKCVFCGSEIRFRVMRGATIPIHQGNHDCVGRKLYRSEHEDICHPTKCPVCDKSVFFLRHNGGCVWLDGLGYPWPKHGCFEVEHLVDIVRPLGLGGQVFRLATITNVQRLADWSGYVLFISCRDEPELRFRVEADVERHDLDVLDRKHVFYSKPLKLIRTLSGAEYSISAHIPQHYGDRVSWYIEDFGADCPLCGSEFRGSKTDHIRDCSEYVWLRPADDRYKSKILRYCEANGTMVPAGFGRRSPKRYVVVRMDSSPPKIVAVTWSEPVDTLRYIKSCLCDKTRTVTENSFRVFDAETQEVFSYESLRLSI